MQSPHIKGSIHPVLPESVQISPHSFIGSDQRPARIFHITEQVTPHKLSARYVFLKLFPYLRYLCHRILIQFWFVSLKWRWCLKAMEILYISILVWVPTWKAVSLSPHQSLPVSPGANEESGLLDDEISFWCSRFGRVLQTAFRFVSSRNYWAQAHTVDLAR